ncbi:MAG: TIGR03435 family protein [Bryobacteraceae bacterium]
MRSTRALTTALLFAFGAYAQTFEVTSVKPYVPGSGQGVLPACKNGRFRSVGPLLIPLQWAFNLQTTQQTLEMRAKLPQWTESTAAFYDLEATTRPDATDEECRIMAQKLFADRFRFRFHWDTETGPVYEMVVARSGFKMQPADPDNPAANIEVTRNSRPDQPFAPESSVWKGISMDDLAQMLTNNARGLPVFNKTGIEGRYKYKLAYSVGAEANREFADPELFTAVEQQFGLRLQEARGPVSHFVVDSMERPDTN